MRFVLLDIKKSLRLLLFTSAHFGGLDLDELACTILRSFLQLLRMQIGMSAQLYNEGHDHGKSQARIITLRDARIEPSELSERFLFPYKRVTLSSFRCDLSEDPNWSWFPSSTATQQDSFIDANWEECACHQTQRFTHSHLRGWIRHVHNTAATHLQCAPRLAQASQQEFAKPAFKRCVGVD